MRTADRLVRRAVRHGGPWLGVLTLTSVLGALMELALPFALGRAVDALVAGGPVSGPWPVACAAVVLLGAALEQPDWPAPPNPMELTREAGLEPEPAEILEYHVHAHLDVLVDGVPVTVPAGIGIDTTNPAVVSDDRGVGLTRECDKPCISPLHTHDTDGILHTETATPTPNTLGQFFTEWGVAFAPGRIGEYSDFEIYVDGEAHEGDLREIELSDKRQIAIVIGEAPDEIPSEFPEQ